MLKELKVSRRFALRGALSGIGVAMWLPVLDVMCNGKGDAFAQGEALPTTFGIWFWGNGVHAQYWTPDVTGRGDAWQLKRNMEPFQNVKEHITLVTGLQMLDGGFKGHGWGNVYVLAGGDGQEATVISDIDRHQNVAFEANSATQYLPTIDQLIADQIGGDSLFKSLQTGVMEYRGMDMGTTSKYLSHRGRNEYLPQEKDPRRFFDKLFGAGQSPSEGTSSASALFSKELRRSTLDAVLQDAKRLQQRLGVTDRARLESHMDRVRELEAQIEGIVIPSDGGIGACSLPAEPSAPADNTARSKALNRLLATALACNLTRVFTHQWSGGRDDNTYPEIDINADHHGLTHRGGPENELAADIERYIMEQYADFVQVLSETQVGAKTLLDQTLVYGISDLGEDPYNHNMTNYHVVLSGHNGGKVPGNQHLRFPRRKLSELMLTLLQTMGVETQEFGTWDRTTQTIPEIFG